MPDRTCNAIDKRIGHNIRLHRMRRGMTQADLAAALGVTFQQVQKYENGKNRIAASRLLAVSRLFEVEFAALLEDAL